MLTTSSLVALLAHGCASFGDTRPTTFAVNALITCDVGQTYQESDAGAWDRPGTMPGTLRRELNPVLGQTPGPEKLGAYLAADVALNTVVGFSKLPSWARWAWLGAVGSVEAYLVATHVATAGVCGL